jgi:hypothetical protein
LSIASSVYSISLKSTCDVNLLSKLSIIFKEWRVIVLCTFKVPQFNTLYFRYYTQTFFVSRLIINQMNKVQWVDFKLENVLVSLHSLKTMSLVSIIFKEWRDTRTFSYTHCPPPPPHHHHNQYCYKTLITKTCGVIITRDI